MRCSAANATLAQHGVFHLRHRTRGPEFAVGRMPSSSRYHRRPALRSIAMTLADLRQEYAQKTLSEADVLPDPIAQFTLWMDQAIAAQVPEPTAMVLATVDAAARPSARIVLLKGCDA